MSKERLHLVARYFQKPRPGVNTSQKGWMDHPDNIQWDEQVEVVRNLRNRDQQAQVILDLRNKKILRNSFQTEKTFDEVFEYFYLNYSKYITEVMGQLDPTYLLEMVNRLEKQLEEEKPGEEVQAER